MAYDSVIYLNRTVVIPTDAPGLALDVVESDTAPATPAVGQRWRDTNPEPPVLKVWDGTSWMVPIDAENLNRIEDGLEAVHLNADQTESSLSAHLGAEGVAHSADHISYDNTDSLLTAEDTQAAIDELAGGGTGGGAEALDDLTDVNTVSTPPAEGWLLEFNAVTGIWQPRERNRLGAFRIFDPATVSAPFDGDDSVAFGYAAMAMRVVTTIRTPAVGSLTYSIDRITGTSNRVVTPDVYVVTVDTAMYMNNQDLTVAPHAGSVQFNAGDRMRIRVTALNATIGGLGVVIQVRSVS
jgi:hypothetical protein